MLFYIYLYIYMVYAEHQVVLVFTMCDLLRVALHVFSKNWYYWCSSYLCFTVIASFIVAFRYICMHFQSTRYKIILHSMKNISDVFINCLLSQYSLNTHENSNYDLKFVMLVICHLLVF